MQERGIDMVEGKYITAMEDMSGLREIWQKVLLEECGWTSQMLDLDEEKLKLHAIAFEGTEKRPVAAGTIEYGEDAFFISNIAVLKEKRRTGYGDFIVRMLVNKAVITGGMPVRAEVTKEAEPLFQEVGFQADGVTYEKNGIVFCPYQLQQSQIKSCCDCSK